MSHRPTTLSLLAKHCARAVSYYEQGVPYDRDIFEPGTTAHAILQALVEATNEAGRVLDYEEMQAVAREVCERLLETGRKFEGQPEPPLHLEAVWTGRDIALAWAARHPFEPGGMAEVGLAVDETWEPIRYGGEDFDTDEGTVRLRPYFRHIADHIQIDEGGESEFDQVTVTITDYKGWAADAERLQHPQQRAAAVLTAIHYPEAAVLVRRVVNLRTGGMWTETMHLGFPETEEILEEWRADIDSAIAVLDRQSEHAVDGLRPASPGGGCIKCPYLGRCDEGLDYWENVGSIGVHGSIEEKARAYAVVCAVKEQLEKILKAEHPEPIEVDEWIVGYQVQNRRVPKPDAHRALMQEFGVDHEPTASLLAGLKLGKGNVEALLKRLYPTDREHREEVLREITMEKNQKRYVVVPK